METFVAELTACRKALTKLRESVLKTPERAGAALGPNIWLLSDAPTGGPDKQAKRAINLNTAERDELLHASRAKLSADVIAKLESMKRAMEQAGVYSRE